jgi:hypothetical protein
MDKFKELEQLIADMKADMEKIFHKGTKVAGVRVRKQLQHVKILAQEIREQIQLVNLK